MKASQARYNSFQNKPESVPRVDVLCEIYDKIRYATKMGMVEISINILELGPYEISKLLEDGYHVRKETWHYIVYW